MNSVSSSLVCLHCGAEVRKHDRSNLFCCAGCEYVYQLIHENQLDQFYDFQDGKLQPAPSTVFQNREYQWIKEVVSQEEKNPKMDLESRFSIQGISCVGCIWLLERVYLKEPGAISCEIDTSAGSMALKWKRGEIDLAQFAQKIQRFGYLLGKFSKERHQESRQLLSRIGLCGAFAMNSMLFAIPTYLGMEKSFEYAPLFARLLLFFSTLTVLVGGSYFFRRCWEGFKNGVYHIDIPIGLGIAIAYASSVIAWSQNRSDFLYLEFVSTFTFLMLVGRWAHLKSVEENRNRLLQEEEALTDVLSESSERKILNDEIQIGTRFRLISGGAVPVQSIFLSEEGTFGMDWISGETDLRCYQQGEIIPAGALSLQSQPILLEAKEAWQDSLLKSLIDVQERKTHRNFLLERFVKFYLLFILIVACGAGMGWYLKTGNGFKALQIITSILVVSCPCASGVAIPMIDDRAALSLRKYGVYLKESTLWHRLLKVKKIIFDKTGTLTLESLELESPQSLRNLNSEEQIRLFSLVRRSLHPVCTSIRKELLAFNPQLEKAAPLISVEEIVGKGVEMIREGKVERLGRSSWACGDQMSRTVWVCDGKIILDLKFKEKVREEARETIQNFLRQGYEIYLLSGDRSENVHEMGAILGVAPDHLYAEMSPQDKALWIEKNNHFDTLMLGDGANDSLAFNRSFCTGTPAIDRGFLQKKSDFYWLGGSLKGISFLFEVAQLRQRAIRAVIAFALIYNFITLGISIAGEMSPVLAAILMPSSSIVTLFIAVMGVPLNLKSAIHLTTEYTKYTERRS